MFNSLASALAPEVPPVVDFQHHWNQFLTYYSSTGKRGNDTERASRPVEMTHQIHHLNSMLKLLAQEQRDNKIEASIKSDTTETKASQNSSGGLLPCMEYVVNNQVRKLKYHKFNCFYKHIKTQKTLVHTI